jgi:hypothetical protein
MFDDVPALLRLDEDYDDVQLLVAVTVVFWATPPPSQNSGYEWMETVFSGDAPARSYGNSDMLKTKTKRMRRSGVAN